MRALNAVVSLLFASGVLLAQTAPSQTTTAAAPAGQSYTGVLIDANCQQLNSPAMQSSAATIGTPTSGASLAAAPATTDVHQPTPPARMQTSAADQRQLGTPPPATGTRARTTTSNAAGATGTGNRTDYNTGTADTGAASAGTSTNTGANSTSSSATSGTTGSGLSSGTTGSGYSSGTTGSGYSNTTPNASPTGNASTGSSAVTGSTTSAGTAGMGPVTAPAMARTFSSSEMAACRVSPGTTSFALYSNGRLMVLDPASSQRVAQQLQSSNWFTNNSAASGRDLNVSLSGTMQGDNLSVSNVLVQ